MHQNGGTLHATDRMFDKDADVTQDGMRSFLRIAQGRTSATSRLRSGVADFGTCSVDWQLRIENTRVKLKRLYPKIKA